MIDGCIFVNKLLGKSMFFLEVVVGIVLRNDTIL